MSSGTAGDPGSDASKDLVLMPISMATEFMFPD